MYSVWQRGFSRISRQGTSQTGSMFTAFISTTSSAENDDDDDENDFFIQLHPAPTTTTSSSGSVLEDTMKRMTVLDARVYVYGTGNKITSMFLREHFDPRKSIEGTSRFVLREQGPTNLICDHFFLLSLVPRPNMKEDDKSRHLFVPIVEK